MAFIPAKKHICPAPKATARLTRIWDRGWRRSLLKPRYVQQQQQQQHTHTHTKQNKTKQKQKAWVKARDSRLADELGQWGTDLVSN